MRNPRFPEGFSKRFRVFLYRNQEFSNDSEGFFWDPPTISLRYFVIEETRVMR